MSQWKTDEVTMNHKVGVLFFLRRAKNHFAIFQLILFYFVSFVSFRELGNLCSPSC